MASHDISTVIPAIFSDRPPPYRQDLSESPITILIYFDIRGI